MAPRSASRSPSARCPRRGGRRGAPRAPPRGTRAPASLTSAGMPSSRPTLRGRRRHRDQVDVLEDQRADAARRRSAGTARGDPFERRERREHGGAVRGPRIEPQRRLGDERERALGADDELREVVAGRRLHELAAGADHLAARQHRLEPEHLVAGHAVLHGAHAAGVGGHVAAEARAVLAREDRVDEPVLGRGLRRAGRG